MSPKPTNHTVRRIVLPSGRAIEVVRFNEEDEHLHVCPRCASPLVQPVSWSECPRQRWELTLECPNCRWAASGTYGREQVEQLEDQLDDGLARMLADLQLLTQANMSDEIERFTRALDADVILPEDF
jgi:hypothetical protein